MTILPDARAIARALGGEVRRGQVIAPGPGHSAADRSMSVLLSDTAPDGFVVNSFANDDPITCRDYIKEKLGVPKANGSNGVRHRHLSDADIDRVVLAVAAAQTQQPPKAREFVCAYDYCDADGKLLYQVVRYANPKYFGHRRPDGNGGWINTGSERRVPYRWPELLKHPDATVFICEGEKDADRVASLDLCATTVASGDWTDDCAKALTGRDVVILEDNDETGRKKALEAATALHGVANTVLVRRFADLPERGDVSDWLDAVHGRGADALSSFCFDAPLWAPQGASPQCPHHKDDPSNLAPTIIDCEAWWREPASIPRRQFLYGRHYARRNIGATIGAGGRAKTTQGGYEAVSMAVGHDLASGQVLASGPLRVWMLNGEEDQDELDRRLAAVCQHYGITKANLGGRLFAQSVRDKPLRIASMRKNMPILNEGIVKFMADFIDRNKIDVFMIDPLVSFHAVPESDNPSMDLVIKEGFGAIANRTNSAGEVFHHPGKPKPGQSETVVEDSRGASSVIWAVRAARVLNFMSPEEAAKLGISEDDRRLHIRLVNGKANMGPLGSATWIKLAIESLPSGDEVAVAGPWSPPDPFDGRTPADMQRARDLAAEGTYRHDSRSPKWLGYALANHFDFKVAYGADNEPKDFAKMQAILKTWLKNKVLEIEERKDSDHKLRKYFKPGPFKDGDTSASDD